MKLQNGTPLWQIVKLISSEQTKQSHVSTLVSFGVHQGVADFYVRERILKRPKPWREMTTGEKKASVLLGDAGKTVFRAMQRNWKTVVKRIEEL